MITKCLILRIYILFIDKSSIFSTNNYNAWRGKIEDLYFDIDKKDRRNLLIYYYSF